MAAGGKEAAVAARGGRAEHAAPPAERPADGSGAGLSERLAALSPAQRRLLERLLAEGGPAPGDVPRRPAGLDDLPLSPLQEGLWFLERALGGEGRFSVGTTIDLRGPLDARGLGDAMQRAGDRHEVLRTAVVAPDGSPRQRVLPRPRLRPSFTDLSAAPDPERAARELAEGGMRASPAIAAGSPLAADLLRLGPERHVLVMTAHHLAWDAWSWGVFASEVGAAYAGREADLPELPVQYGDYAVWQRARLEAGLEQAQLAHWRRALDGVPGALDLPADRLAPQGAGGFLHAALPRGLVDRLQALGRARGATLFATALAAYAVLLWRHSRQRDVVVGTPFAADRGRPELERLVGFFVNMLPLRIRIDRDVTFAALVDAVREAAAGAFAHSDVPLDRIVRAVRPPRAGARTPLLQTTFTLRYGEPALTLDGLDAAPLAWGSPRSQYELMVDLEVEPGAARTAWLYDDGRFDRARVAELARQLEAILVGAAERPDAPMGELSLGREAAVAPLRPNAAGTHRAASPAPRLAGGAAGAGCVHERFAAQARARPDAVAVTDGDRALTYRELDAWSDRVCAALQSCGAGHESVVGVELPRSRELVVAFLAVLKAGGAYLPLDPDLPPARRRAILDAAGARLVVDAAFVADAPAAQPRSVPAHPDQLAYVVFTSGSTGRPKGVCATHRGVVGLVAGGRFADVAPGDVVAHVASASFDATTFELWAPLLSGAAVHVVPPDAALSPDALADEVRRGGVTVLHLTSALVSNDMYRRRVAGTGVRLLLFGGDAAAPHAVGALLDGGFGGRAVHCYGPTEATMLAAFQPVARADADRARVPIGGPVGGSELHVLDERLRPVPPGAPGELHVGGPRLARGYLGAPRATADRFVPNPWSRGGRLYRTGDLVRALPCGRLEFLGRLDRQVKVRGFRVEPAEVEAALAALPGVAEASVVAERDAGDVRLVAYAAPLPGRRLDAAALRAALRERLPAYLVPARVVVLDRLPLTRNGKLDRAALPAAAVPAPAALRTATEHAVARAWTQVLRIDRAGPGDDFFDAGGHSLLAVELLARLEDALDVRVPVGTLLADPTLGGIAAWIDGRRTTAPPRIALVHPVGGGTVCYRAIAAALPPDTPVLALETREGARGSLAELAAEHLATLRAAARAEGDEDGGLRGGTRAEGDEGGRPRGSTRVEGDAGATLRGGTRAEGDEDGRLRGSTWVEGDALAPPPVLVGWSSGGVLAHEIARAWHAQAGVTPAVLMIDAWPPAAAGHGRDPLGAFLHDLAAGAGEAPPELPPDVLSGPPRAALARALAAAGDSKAFAGVTLDDLEARFAVFRRNDRAWAAHTPRRYAGPVHLVRPRGGESSAALWRPLCGSLTLHTLPGDHHSLLRPPAAGALARLASDLAAPTERGD
ncbi:MAG TPA: amino acid adenylation domain-containing protein [Solirubrobacteraceae bacterium]|jgi:amino acid adenylation domain-containing protein|nr:amino acid adenylation domain-containing protein [Solirubrobacteraceae bacterium]